MIDINLYWFGVVVFAVSVGAIVLFVVNVGDDISDYASSFDDVNLVLDRKDLEQKKAILMYLLEQEPRHIYARLLLDRVLSYQDRLIELEARCYPSSGEQSDDTDYQAPHANTHGWVDRRMAALKSFKKISAGNGPSYISQDERMYH